MKNLHVLFKVLWILLSIYPSTGRAQQADYVTVEHRLTTVAQLIRLVENHSDYSFVYSERVPLSTPISVEAQTRISVAELLKQALVPTPVHYRIQKKHILLTWQPDRTVTISGYVCDRNSGETLIGANIVEMNRRTGTPTNNYGFYSLTLPAGAVNLAFSYLGFQTHHFDCGSLQRDTVINVTLGSDLMIKEVVVVSDKKQTGFTATHTGAVEMPIQQIKKIPAILGEADVIKSIQLMPGIASGVEGMSGLYVRGGGGDQNLYCLDGVQVYNVDHLMGFASVFSPEAVKHVDLYKGSFPARFGGRLSSVIDVHTNDGDLYQYHGMFSIGLLSSQVNLQGPLWKGKTAFNFSARRSYYDLLARPFMPDDSKYYLYFSDMNLKVNHQFSDRSRLYLSLYHGSDQIKTRYDYQWNSDQTEQQEREAFHIRWGNAIASMRWNYILNNKLFSNTTVAFNRYQMKYDDDDRITSTNGAYSQTKYRYNSGIHDWSVQSDFDFYPNHQHHIRFGGAYIFHTFQPEVMQNRDIQMNDAVRQDTLYRGDNNRQILAHEASLYVEDDLSLGERLVVSPGVRLTMFHVREKTYLSAQPRLSGRYAISDRWALKGAYSRMNQYINLLTTTSLSLPTDLWVPVTDRLKPMSSDQYSLGVYYDRKNGWEFSMETYYKQLRHILEYNDGESFSGSSKYWEEIVSAGSGRAYGVEWLAQRKVGKATGWISYALSRSDRKFDSNINNGRRFPYKYDHRHQVNMVLNYRFSARFDLGATWKFISGGAVTVANQQTVILMPDQTTEVVQYADRRGNFCLPATHLLNLSANFNKKTKHGVRTWNISLYNAYNAMNPAFVYSKRSGNSTYVFDPETGSGVVTYADCKTVLKKLTIFPMIPSFTYTYRF